MAVTNADIAAVFEEIADLLDIQGENPFRVRAYHNAARTVQGLSRSLAEMVAKSEDLEALPTIGKDLAEKIREIVQTGRLRKLKELERAVSPDLAALLKIPGIGPRRVRMLHEQLDIDSVAELEKAARAGRIRKLPGFGATSEANILKGLSEAQQRSRRYLWSEVEAVATQLADYLKAAGGVRRVTVAGSYRRRRETLGDLDILATAASSGPTIDRFVNYEDVERVISRGDTRSTVVLHRGLQVDLRVVPAVSFGSALHYFTGSRAHNIAVRARAVRKGLKINEYGVFRGEERIAGKTEKEVFATVGLPYIEPELRENRGELEAASRRQLPKLITEADIRGDLHMHTRETDGRDSLETLVTAAREKGYAYFAITDHSQHLTVAKGLTPERLLRQCEAIDRLNESLSGIRILKGIEVDILEDGQLDLKDDVLAYLDICVGAVHSAFGLSRRRQTARIIRAMDNPHLNIFAHPTGRLLGKRRAYEVDIEKVLAAARDRGCFLEVNCQPERLDLNDVDCRLAKDLGVKLAISTDAHSAGQLNYMRFGIAQARRGWLEKHDVINTLPLKALLRRLKR
jgi:DNA polymerase (family 10)